MTKSKKSDLLYQVIKSKWKNELDFRSPLDNKATALASISFVVLTLLLYNVRSILAVPEKINCLTFLVILGGLVSSFTAILFSLFTFKMASYDIGAEIEDLLKDFSDEGVKYEDWLLKIVKNYQKDVNKNAEITRNKGNNLKVAFWCLCVSVLLMYGTIIIGIF